MHRKITLFLIVLVCFVLQTTVFQYFSFAGIAPNLLIVVVSAFGFMRGRREGLFIGFFCGLLIDVCFGDVLGVYALIYMYIGYMNGFFQKSFYPEDIKLPVMLIGGSDLVCNMIVYIFMFFFRNKYDLGFYLKAIMLPELIYTMVVAILVYFLLLKINQKLEAIEKRSAKKFDL